MPSCYKFDSEIPFDCLFDLIRIVREGELVEKKYEAIQHGAWFIGCAAAKLGGSPDVFGDVGASEAITIEDLVDDLESRLSGNPGLSGSDEEPSEIDPLTIISIIGIVIRIISALRR